MPSHICDMCDEPAIKRCAGCEKVWYCSPKCQKDGWILHIFDCDSRAEITTAHHLVRACYKDRIPNDLRTREDYGFTRVIPEHQSKLLGFYIGLIVHQQVPAKKIDKWRVRGALIEQIKAQYEKVPEGSRGLYYPWFLKNQYVLDISLAIPSTVHIVENMIVRANQYAGLPALCPEGVRQRIFATWPKSKVSSYNLCAMVLFDAYPDFSINNWTYFGFCTCSNEHAESSLCRLYHELLNSSSFEEFWTAFDTSSLLDLFERKGMSDRLLLVHPNLQDVLSGSPREFKSVWFLMQFITANDGSVPLKDSVAVDYGFKNCRTQEETDKLWDLYRRVLLEVKADPLQLYAVAIAGKILEFVSGSIKMRKSQRKELERLLKNPYPLIEL